MALEMKPECEKCGRPLAGQDEAFLCSYECTVCASCVKQMSTVCPNWGGELVRPLHREDEQTVGGRFARRTLAPVPCRICCLCQLLQDGKGHLRLSFEAYCPFTTLSALHRQHWRDR